MLKNWVKTCNFQLLNTKASKIKLWKEKNKTTKNKITKLWGFFIRITKIIREKREVKW
jgi:hypothetical protein